MGALYNLLLLFLAPIWVPLLWWKNRNRQDKVNWKERQGEFPIAPRGDRKRIWIHAVSVGEVMAAKPILERVRNLAPEFEIVLSCTTGSGLKAARDSVGDIVSAIVAFPIDVARFQFSAMQRVQPCVVAIMETELWMNFLTIAKNFGATTLLVNGRISDRSFERSKWIRPMMRAIVAKLDRSLMQTERDAERMSAYGASSVEVFGNSKFDQAIEANEKSRDAWRAELGLPCDAFVVIVGSTRGAEEEAFVFAALDALSDLNLSVIYAPRHLERCEAIAGRASARGPVARRSKAETGRFLLLDTYGELASLYAAGDVAIIGGGFEDFGGQNLLQPISHGLPVLHGVHMQNFRDVAEAAQALDLSVACATPEALAHELRSFAESPERRAKARDAAHRFMAANVGASDRYAAAIVETARAYQARHADWLAKRA